MNALSIAKSNRSYLNSPAPIPNAPALNLESVRQELINWRKNKRTRFDPIPDNIKSQIFELLLSKEHKISGIGRKLCLSVRQLKAIKALFSDNKVDNSEEQLELLPFKLIPANHATVHSQDSIVKDKKASLSLGSADTARVITICKADGSYISLPSSLSDSLITCLVTSFLCCK